MAQILAILLDPLITLPALATGYWSNSLKAFVWLGVWVLVIHCVAAPSFFWETLFPRMLIAGLVGGAVYAAAGSQRRWRRGEL